jgi:predicted helicase
VERVGEVEYTTVTPAAGIGYPLMPRTTAEGYLDWPKLPELYSTYFAGVQTKRDDFVIDVDRDRLSARLAHYFDAEVPDAEMAQISPASMRATNRFDPTATRRFLQQRGFLPSNLVRHIYRPFDRRWIYWEPETRLLGEKSPEYFPEVVSGNLWLTAVQRNRKGYTPALVAESLASLHLVEWSASLFPLFVSTPKHLDLLTQASADDPRRIDATRRYNLSDHAVEYLSTIGSVQEDAPNLFHHAIAVMHAPRTARRTRARCGRTGRASRSPRRASSSSPPPSSAASSPHC